MPRPKSNLMDRPYVQPGIFMVPLLVETGMIETGHTFDLAATSPELNVVTQVHRPGCSQLGPRPVNVVLDAHALTYSEVETDGVRRRKWRVCAVCCITAHPVTGPDAPLDPQHAPLVLPRDVNDALDWIAGTDLEQKTKWDVLRRVGLIRYDLLLPVPDVTGPLAGIVERRVAELTAAEAQLVASPAYQDRTTEQALAEMVNWLDRKRRHDNGASRDALLAALGNPDVSVSKQMLEYAQGGPERGTSSRAQAHNLLRSAALAGIPDRHMWVAADVEAEMFWALQFAAAGSSRRTRGNLLVCKVPAVYGISAGWRDASMLVDDDCDPDLVADAVDLASDKVSVADAYAALEASRLPAP